MELLKVVLGILLVGSGILWFLILSRMAYLALRQIKVESSALELYIMVFAIASVALFIFTIVVLALNGAPNALLLNPR